MTDRDAFGDAYCTLAWGERLAELTDEATAVGVVRGRVDGLSRREAALVAWARLVARDPNAATVEDVAVLRDAGLSDDTIFSVTAFVALRAAFSIVNDALGVTPDRPCGSACRRACSSR